MAATPRLLQRFIDLMRKEQPPSFMLNKSFDVATFAQSLLKDIEDKRSSITAITREQAKQLGQENLKFSSSKHESRINAFYRLLGLPTELDLSGEFELKDSSDNKIKTRKDLIKVLLQREYEQLILTFKQFLQSNSLEDLNKQLDGIQAKEQQLIAELFDPNHINTSRLFPMIQFSQIQNIVENTNRISPSFASIQERYVNETLTKPPFLESVITIRLLPQSGGSKINTQGAVEDAVLQSLGFALGELVKQYQRNQSEAEKHLLDGIATIRSKVPGINSPIVKSGDINANQRENDGITVPHDIRSTYTQQQIDLYAAVISLVPLENDIIPTGLNIQDTPFQSRNIKENALTGSFLDIIRSNIDALNRIQQENRRVFQKRQLIQDKLTAELGSSIGEIGGISLAEILIVIAALFVLDEEDLIGLLSKSRFDQIISASNNNTSTSSRSQNSAGQPDTAQKQINIFDILAQFKDSRTNTTMATKILQDVVKAIYNEFLIELGHAHIF